MPPADRPSARQRNRLLLALVAVSLLVTAAVVWVVVRGARDQVQHATRTSIAAAVDQTEAHLEGFFELINELLLMTSRWGANGELTVDDEAAFAAHFVPVLERTPVSSLMLADDNGAELMLLETADGFRTRQTRPAEWGTRARWTRWRESRDRLETWDEELGYDARKRPWYRAARDTGGARLAFTQPYTFFTTREPGVTGSHQFSVGGAHYVIGFDVLLNDISRLTAGIELTPHGRVAVLSADGRVVGLPRDPRFEGEGLVDAVLKPADEIGVPEIGAALVAGAAAEHEHFAFDSGGERWWGGLRPVEINGQRFHIVVALPERDVVGDADTTRNRVILILLAGLAVAGVLLFLFQRMVHRDLARAAARPVKIGQYTLEHQIGAGGMGTVYRASHALLRRPTAIKLLAATRAKDPKAVARFKREVELTSRLTHPNTIAIYDFGFTTDGVFYYAMEYLEGVDLRVLVEQGGAVPSARAVHILAQIASSLAEAHAAGLIHRDIKPSNVILCERGGMRDFVKVLDFGLVKNIDNAHADESARLTQDGSIAGTPDYLSPEAINTPREIGPPSDMYALGALGYFLVTGEPPFPGKTFMDICIKHIRQPPAPLPDAVDGDLAELLLRCLAKEPDDRPTANQVAETLSQCEIGGQWGQRQASAWWREHADLLHREDFDDTSAKTIQVPLDSASS